MVAAIAVLLKDAGKLTLGQPLTVLASHAVEALVRQPPDRWLSYARMTYYQALLLDSDRVNFGPTVSLNPATLLPLPSPSEEHDCLQILAEAPGPGTRPDLKDPDAVWYTDGSSFLEEGERRAGAAITTESEVVWASSLPPGTSAQRAELIALTQALRMAEGKKLTVYNDSRYAFATAHVHGEIYRRRGLLPSAGKEIPYKNHRKKMGADWEQGRQAYILGGPDGHANLPYPIYAEIPPCIDPFEQKQDENPIGQRKHLGSAAEPGSGTPAGNFYLPSLCSSQRRKGSSKQGVWDASNIGVG
ncbi:uncharacterized protein LOC128104757 [Peromyscus californicus insignis]|uniref:uncharacterized protein LOC128104757 n=1 Tax=Peromyscus californicus insignis TaxID=564181 RepID=UPI0022A6D615|nr:uncharacterized protein LOC128104757 [Peromyscus californicus insignis]XP_052585747.1 uncharacterized protein LOC128104757 [Peromyscus californicus insignis]XP_052585748.1 uncharacterized protein LOC128104757 [Peromyscus californicus insignis]XP_052585749.1 uncharacterized protein LOC128104757 [Peromyscus californicus insignis]